MVIYTHNVLKLSTNIVTPVKVNLNFETLINKHFIKRYFSDKLEYLAALKLKCLSNLHKTPAVLISNRSFLITSQE